MKKNIFKKWGFMPLALLLGACSSDKADKISYDGEVRKVIARVKNFVHDGNSTTRTNVDPSKGFSWAANDTIGIFPEKGDQLPFAMTSGAGTSVATITGGSWGLKTSEGYASYYPFSRQNYFTDRGNIFFSYAGQRQTGDNSTQHLGAYDLMAADNAQAKGDNLNFNFNHLGCILRLKVTVPNAGTYSSATLCADEAVFGKKVKLDLTQATAQLTKTETSKSITLALDDFTTPSNNYQAVLYMMCAPFDLAQKSITLKLRGANGYTYSCTKTLSKAYAPSMLYTINFNALTLESAPSIGIGGEFETSDSDM